MVLTRSMSRAMSKGRALGAKKPLGVNARCIGVARLPGFMSHSSTMHIGDFSCDFIRERFRDGVRDVADLWNKAGKDDEQLVVDEHVVVNVSFEFKGKQMVLFVDNKDLFHGRDTFSLTCDHAGTVISGLDKCDARVKVWVQKLAVIAAGQSFM